MTARLVPEPATPVAGEAAGAVSRLELAAFRNYRRLELAVTARPVVLFGPNGAGKTNLLEALSLLTPGRGLRRARLAELDHRGGGRFRLRARVETVDGPREVESWHDPENGRRVLAVDGAACRSSAELARLCAMVWLTPAMDRILVEGPAGRRRFLDRLTLALYPDHAARVTAFERAMRERAHLLRSRRPDPVWLDALERRMAQAAVAIAAARRDLVAGLEAELARGVEGFPSARLALAGEVEEALGRMSALEVEQWLAGRLAESRTADAEGGGAAHGTHRSDLLVFLRAGEVPAAACSTGQQKALLLAVLLAETRLRRTRAGDWPVLLLDEVAAHLDAERRRALFEALVAMGAQCWLTGTDAELFRPLFGRAAVFHLNEATLREHG